MLIKDLIKEINQNKNLERNLPVYVNELMTLHNSQANYFLTFHYYTFVEMLMENDYSDIEGLQEECKVIRECIEIGYKEEATVEELNNAAKRLDELRTNVIAKMKVLTAYTDIFQIYEYIINRLEKKYDNKIFTVDDEEFSKKIMQYIFTDKDNAAVNAKVQEIVGQLPVRMTKSRFLDLVKDSLSIYRGGDKISVETFLYMIRTAASIDRPEGFEQIYPKLVEYKEQLDTADYKNLTLEQYVDQKLVLEKAVILLERTAEVYYTMQEAINDIYVHLLTRPYANMPGTIELFAFDMKVCADVVLGLNQLNTAEQKTVPANITTLLNTLVGKQERLIEIVNVADSVFYDVEINQQKLIESMMLSQAVNCLDCVMKLQSNSIFVELDREPIIGDADDIYMKRTEKTLLTELDEILSKTSQTVSRGIMASVLSRLPVFFNNQNEISEYILHSITSCKDEAEKCACIELIQGIIG